MYPNVTNFILNSIWLIQPEKLHSMLEVLKLRNAGQIVDGSEKYAADKFESKRQKSVGVIPLSGIITQKANMISRFSGGTSTELFKSEFVSFLNNDEIGAIVIDIDSPGGSTYGIKELSDTIYNSRGRKPIYAIANSLAASAAYWIASAADKLYVTPGGEVGSVGVYTIHTDFSAADEKEGIKTTIIRAGKHKVEANPHEPLTDDIRAEIQKRIDDIYGDFVSDLDRNRGKNTLASTGLYGEGKVYGAREAVKIGMVDGVKTYDELIDELVRAEKPDQFKNRMAAVAAKIRLGM